MTYITIKTKKTKANVEIFPPNVLDGRSHISLVDIRIPEEETKINKHEQTVAICQSKVNSIKDRISKALNDNKISDEEFHNIISEADKYNEMKRDTRNSPIEKNIPNEVELKQKIRLEMMKKLQAVSINHLESK